MHSKKTNIWALSWRYVSPHKRLFFLALIFGIIYGVTSGFGIPVIFQKVFKQIFETQELLYPNWQIGILALFIPVTFFVRGIFGFLSTYWMTKCGLEILKGLREDIFTHLQYVSLRYFDTRNSGDLINRVISDPRALQDLILEMAAEFFKQPLQMIAAFIGLIYLSIQSHDIVFLGIFAIAMPLCFLPVRLLRKQVKQYGRDMQNSEATMTQRVSENLHTVQEVRTFRLEEYEINRLKRAMNIFNDFVLKVTRWQKMQQPMMEVTSAIILAVIFVYAYLKKIPFSVFSAMGMGLYFAFDPIKKISNLWAQIHRSTGALERILDVIQTPIEITEPLNPVLNEKISGEIEFRNVSFRYIEKGVASALEDISLKISAQTTCALVGPSGAGKSTFIKLLPRLYDTTHGQILIDDVDIKNYSLATLRNHIGFVSQHPVLFNDTVFNNLRVGNFSASQDEIIAAAKAAYAHDFICKLENGYETRVGDSGGRLSGGQRQRIALARAFLKNAPILILDEATSALDSESEYFVRKAVDLLGKNKTVIAIAHRLSTIQHADVIVVLDKGKCVAQGTHSSLLKECTLYQTLVEKQLLQV